jgi:type II secretory pathway component PulK
MRYSRKQQQGSALLIVMLVMAMMGIIGFAALEAVTRDQRVAGFMKRKKIAFFAAEAGVSAALHALRTTSEPDFTGSTVGDGAWFKHGLPTYSLDASGGVSTKDLGLAALPGFNLNIQELNSPKFTIRYYEVKVKGETFGGTVSRIAFASGRIDTVDSGE